MKKRNQIKNFKEVLMEEDFLKSTHPLLYTSDPNFSTTVEQKEILFNNKKRRDGCDVFHEQRAYVATVYKQQLYVGSERRVPLNGAYNCRDLGGYYTKDGQMTKWGYLFRSDALDHLTKKEQHYLSQVGIQTVVDFRSPVEIARNPDKMIGEKTHLELDPQAEIAKRASEMSKNKTTSDEIKVKKLEHLARTEEGKETLIKWQKQMIQQMQDLVMTKKSQAAYATFLAAVNQKTNSPALLFHCQGGKDRTGWGAALVLGLLGVDKATIYQDYLLTDRYNRPRNDKRMSIYKQYTRNPFVLDYLASLQQTKVAYLDGAFDVMEKNFGTIENYAKEALDFGHSDIQSLRANYLYQPEEMTRIYEYFV